MLKYKDTNGKLHAIESEEWVHLLPVGCVRVSDEEAALIENPPKTLDQLKDDKKAEIRAAFEVDEVAPVVVNGTSWDGGFDSAMKLDAGKRLAEAAGFSTVTLYDVDNKAHDLTIPEAQGVILAVATAFQTAFARKQAAMVATDLATTATKVGKVSY